MTGPHVDERWRANWVPVDRRLLGMDRRTLLPAALVVLLFAVAVWIVPAINDRVSVDDPIKAGDVIQVGTDVRFVPVVGANLLAGLRQGQSGAAGYPGTAAVSYGGVTFEVIADTYRGTPAQLLAQIKKTNEGLRVPDDAGFHVTGDPVTISNGSGEQGVAADFEGTNGTGLVAAFVFGETGVEVEIVGPRQVPDGVARQVAAMLQSVEPVGSTS
ncbi:hypothetical protein [Paractinoplanes atraurantiacus]|uniref:Uncharacterized protein n=1 Tax=Paractinoplanes atraurantiacus TaxID=1036182 RepID=A0A285J3B6_9ACTN|nr:hypothetical protein [Actinoplanes atraurantiacus]SNY53856.1 hypothetical protein SAMN05421748_114191 [Actinoplanes atraurantiacus]